MGRREGRSPGNKVSTLIMLQRLLDPIIAVILLLLLKYFLGVGEDAPYILLAAIAFLLIVPVFKAVGLYRSFRTGSFRVEITRLLIGWAIVEALLLLLGYMTKTSSIFSRTVLLTWAISVPPALYLGHWVVQGFLQQLWLGGRSSRKAVIAGIGEVSTHLAEQLSQAPHLGIKIVGFFDECWTSVSSPNKRALLGNLQELPDYVRRHRIDVVYLTSAITEPKLAELIQELQDTTACVYFVPNILMFTLMQARTQEFNGIPVIAIWEIPFSDVQHDLKRLVDIVVASFALLLLSPLMVLIAIGVKLSSPGPILFTQRRYGLNGQEITVYKFRTMKVMEDGEVIRQAQRNDPRVTKLGAFLRRTSLDELPQFINVLQGRMSIVGPRPHAIAHNELYRKLISGYMLRHKVKPGITGWAQVHGFRGETDTLEKMQKRVEYDLEYFKNWSLALDLEIILRTFIVFFHHPNAY